MVVTKSKMNIKSFELRILIVAALLSVIFASPLTITAPPTTKNTVTDEKDDLRQFLGHCLHKGNVSKCLKNRVVDLIDEAITNNDEWSTNFFNMKFSLNKNPDFKENTPTVDQSRTFEDIISQKLKNLMESRVVQVKLSDEDSSNETSLNSNEPSTQPEGRKKKDGKHGNHMMMMSGMAVMAMMIQLFLSKVAFVSGAALLLAKIALLFSTLSGLKKSGGSGGSEHVVYSADIAKQGWQRSIQAITPTIPQSQIQHTDDDLAYRGHPAMTSYDGV